MSRLVFTVLAIALASAAPLRAEAPAAAEKSFYSSDQLAADLARSLQRHFHLEGELQVDFARAWAAPEAAAARWDFAVAEYPGLPSANMVVRIRLRADGRLVDNSALLLHAALWRDAWFAREPIAAGTTFSPALLDPRRIDAFHEREALSAGEGDDSYIFARQIGPDRLLTWHDIVRRPLVHRGQVVDVTAAEGRLSLTMKALAMENGARGDLVRVRNLESRKDISALVVGDDRVQVRF